MSGISKFKRIYSEGVAEKHPDIAGQTEFANKADEILARRKKDREKSAKNAKNARLDAIGRELYNMNKIGEETSCGCDAEETPSIKKDKKNKVMDAREIPTKVNLIKTRLRLMGLNMSYEPEGELVEENKSGDKSLRDWFSKSSGTNPKTGKEVKGWVQLGGPFAGAPCARQPGQTSTPKCGSSKMAANLSDKEEEKAFNRKNREDSNQPEKKNAASPTNVRTEEVELQEKEGKKDACYSKVKSRYSVWPSAYASGALVKCRKVGAANWGTKSEETIMEKEMTDKEVKAETKLKSKYDDSGMKASMIQQYGPEKGKQVYFATIRKKAMEEAFMDPEEELPGSRRKPIENVASHPNPKVRKKAVRGMVKQMEKEYGGKWKSSSKDPAVEEQLDYNDAYEFVIETLIDADFAQDYETAENMFECMSDEFVAVILEEYIEEAKRSSKSVQVTDLDDTTLKPSKAKIKVVNSSGETQERLSSHDFAKHELPKEHTYDFKGKGSFDDAGMLKGTSGNRAVMTHMQPGHRRNNPRRINPTSAVTARAQMSNYNDDNSTSGNQMMVQHLRNVGMLGLGTPGGGKLHLTGNMPRHISGPKRKAMAAASIIKNRLKSGQGISSINTYDDIPSQAHSMAHAAHKESPSSRTRAFVARVVQSKPGRKIKGKSKNGDIVPVRLGSETKPFSPGKVGIRANSDAPKTTKQTQRARKKARRNMGEEMTWYKEDFELWVNALIDEGYDLSELTIDELYEGYEEFLDEVVATAAPEPHRPKKQGKFTSPYGKGKKLAPKKEYKAEDFTPYEFWMNIIETQQPEETEEVVEEEFEEIVEEGPTTSYDYWKNYIEENANFGNN
jgi:hypothetical protein